MNKRKLLTLAMTLCMVAILAVGGTLAYFTAEDELTNTFTSGNIKILLDEAKVKQDDNGDYIQDGETRTEEGQEYDLHPGISVLKDPTIHLNDDATGTSEALPAYIAAKIIITGADLDGTDMIATHQPYIDITKLVSGGIVTTGATYHAEWQGLNEVHINDNCVAYQVPDAANDTWTIYVFVKAPVQPGEDVVLFEEIKIPEEYNNDQMAKLNGLNIDVAAYATQIDTFSDEGEDDGVGCLEAMKAAFPTAFAL